ncbi:DUF2844 domain-containing protein [Paraburkholderia sp. UYCP14C]|uniref:DUF2844 domain-containing protein n=1 Tax=Paraburkholderia sp. UYCP14C TaxID=2511130 RepID=UPI00102236BE|nr:DUF2844 domain-containing protein [Paraburkholderia sp. UYCP14C]RZF28045.1 DUF2844 domain-containing protein [Paraburkholderia sp. UYCP14C]
MWSRFRRAGISALVLPCSILVLTAAQSAHAALGSAPLTPPSDASVSSRVVQPASGSTQGVMRSEASAASSTSSSSASYTVRETTFGNGTVVREYLGASGAVFGIAWHGPQMPDLSDLLGSYFPQYVAGVKAVRAARGNARGPVAVDGTSVMVRSGGHMGAFSGVAWLPSALPAGVSGSDIQ